MQMKPLFSNRRTRPMRWGTAAAVVLLLLGILHHDCAWAKVPTLESLAQASSELSEQYAKLKGWEDPSGVERKARLLDRMTMEVVRDLFAGEQSFEDIQASSAKVLKWCEWPRNLTKTKWIRFAVIDHDPRIRVHYRAAEIGTRGKLWVISNSFWNRKGRARVSPSIYGITRIGGNTRLDVIRDSGLNLVGLAYPLRFLGFKKSGDGISGIFVLDGPGGSGCFADLYFIAYDPERGKWVSRRFLGYSHSGTFAYDEKKGVFTIHDKGVFQGWTIPGDVGNSMDLDAMTEPEARSLLSAALDPPEQDVGTHVEPEMESSGDEPDPPSGSPGT